MKRYGIRHATSLVPMVEVTSRNVVSLHPYEEHHTVVRRFYGFTFPHAWNRALHWTREHGDPR